MMLDLDRQLMKIAGNALARARAHGELLIADTKRGTVAVRHEEGTYTLTKCARPGLGDLEVVELAKGPSRVVKPVLAQLYIVEEAA